MRRWNRSAEAANVHGAQPMRDLVIFTAEVRRMPHSARLFIILGALNAFLAVLLGAFGAHALKARLAADLMAVFHTGNQYHFYHALGLLLVGVIAVQLPDSALLRSAGWLMLTGIALFSGSLYVLAISGVRWLGAITPFGGLAFLAAWVLLAIAVWKAG
jgi:uncharacterized membrane protein YgdD (TMEM256/DUF423 family)